MAYLNYVLILCVFLASSYGKYAEFVPVYLWGTNRMTAHVPALHKISQDSFKDTFLEYLQKDPFVIVFTERTLSPEDFAQRDISGESAFENLQELKNEGNFVSYRPYVQNPIGAIKQANKPITEISISSILSNINVPKENIWIINLDDAKDDESRVHMLKRHDYDIVSIYKDILKKYENVLALYTANHTAWVAPDDLPHVRARSLLETKATVVTPITFKADKFLLYLTAEGVYKNKETVKKITKEFQLTNAINESSGMASLEGAGSKIQFDYRISKAKYWYINKITVDGNELDGVKDIYAPKGFSYHCGVFNLTSGKDIIVALPGFQIQVFSNNTKFGDAYDCIGFTSVPIWSGLFVTAILLLIITFGLTMMMDIKTMDRFDDPKGKTITVTASE